METQFIKSTGEYIITLPGAPRQYRYANYIDAKRMVDCYTLDPNFFLRIMPVRGHA